MKILKLIIVCLALFAGEKLLAQGDLIVNNNTNLDNGFASFGFGPVSGCDHTVPFWANTTGNMGSYSCTLSTLRNVIITFDDPSCPSNPQAQITLTPSNPTFMYMPCGGGSITFQLSFVSPDWVLDIF